MRAIAALSLLGLAACQGGKGDIDDKRVAVPEDGLSYAEPTGYAGHRDRDAWVLSGEGDRARTTIAIRTAPNREWASDVGGRGRPADLIIPAVKTALGALPGAELGPVRERSHDLYPAYELELTFSPPGKSGQKYQRRHAVVFADERVIHVFHTAPVGRLAATAADFDRVVDSIREEG
jgi:hypothetical protein